MTVNDKIWLTWVILGAVGYFGAVLVDRWFIVAVCVWIVAISGFAISYVWGI